MKQLILGLAIISISAISSAQNTTTNILVRQADSLVSLSAWSQAIPLYEKGLQSTPENGLSWNRLGYCYYNVGDLKKAMTAYQTALSKNPPKQVQAIVHSRIAKIQARQHEADAAFASLDQAIAAGYGNWNELTTSTDFDNIRSDKRFDAVTAKVNAIVFPCMSDRRAREFDFWIGEWDVYPNGAPQIVGNSKIEMASGGCMILENWTALGSFANTGKSMNYFNTVTGTWEQLWIGSGGMNANNPQKFVNGVYKDGAMRFDFVQVNAQGQTQTGRFIFYNQGKDQVRQFNEVSSDGGKTWTTVYDFIYKRRK